MRWCWVLCIIGFLFSEKVVAQQAQYAFRINFTDKVGAPSTSNPLVFLSQRALDRRTAQNIAIDSIDRPVSPAYMDSVLTLTGGKKHVITKWLNACVILLTDSSKILNLQGKPYVQAIKYVGFYPSGLHRSSSGGNPKFASEKKMAKTTGTLAYYGASFEQSQLVNGDYLHDIGFKGEGMLIAVMDEGFSFVNTGPAFDSMMKANRVVDGYNFVLDNNTVFDYSTHGTFALSTMAGNLPGTYVGTAPYASYALYCTEDGNSEQEIEMDNLVAAAERADSLGADVISVSLGYNEFFLPKPFTMNFNDFDGKTTVATRGANIATSRGILFVQSAGNEGGNSWNKILTPSDADSALTVGNVNIGKIPASNSGYGPNAAGHIKPNVCMPGQPAVVMSSTATPTSIGGTSFATPQLAGWAACLIQSVSNPTPYKIRTAIEKSAHVYATPGVQLGYGVPDFRKAFDFLDVDSPVLPTPSEWLAVTPNPFDAQLTLQVKQSFGSVMNVVLTDVSGKEVYKHSESVAQGTQIIRLELPQLSRGVYFLKVSTDANRQVLKLVKR